MDWHFQNAQEKAAIMNEAGIPVWVMEPLRGGRLAKASGEMVLSGMSSMEQLRANIATYETDRPLTREESDALITCMDGETKKAGLPCTACHYCTSHCPQKLPIPELIALYNEHKATEGGFIAPMAVSSMPPERRPASCIGCRSCEQVCPRQINISGMMKDFTAMIGM